MSKKNDDFAKLKDQVTKKKDKNKKDNGNIDGNGTINSNGNGNGNIDGNDDGNVNGNIKSDNKQETESTNSGNNKSSKAAISLSKKKEEPQKIKRTYYIHEKNDEQLNELARHSGKDKSELIRIAIDFLYNNAEVN